MSVDERSVQDKLNMSGRASDSKNAEYDAVRSKEVRIGTRGSELALAQTELVVDALREQFPEADFQIVRMSTRGDRDTSRALLEFGGKAVFVEEFEEALLSGDIDIAVHSAKDMPMDIMDGLAIAGTLPRACPQDVLIYKSGKTFAGDDKFVIGTSSLRRQYQIKSMYPQAECRNLRGNVGTRIQKLIDGEYDAIILAAAGLERLGIIEKTASMQRMQSQPKDSHEIYRDGLTYRYLSTDDLLPAACQGIIAIETKDSGETYEMVKTISDTEAYTQLTCERAVLKILNAGCHEPIGVYSEIDGEHLKLSLMKVDESSERTESPTEQIHRRTVEGYISSWQELAKDLIK